MESTSKQSSTTESRTKDTKFDSPSTELLSKDHRRQLQESAISAKTIDFMVEAGAVRSLDEGLGFRYPNETCQEASGEVVPFWRTRLDHPSRGGQKYTQPAGSGSRVYVPYVRKEKPDWKSSLVIVEGEKKAIAVAERLDQCEVLGIGGIWSWIDKKGSNRLLKALDARSLYEREVVIMFDSDTGFKPDCRKAEAALVKELKERGAVPKVLVLPVKHKGIDDWFYAWKAEGTDWAPLLRDMWRAAVSVRPAEDYSRIYSEVYSYDEMLKKEFPVPRFFLGGEDFGLVAEGMVTFLHSKTNLGKTYLATQMAVSIATGEEFLGLTCGNPGSKVLVLQGELPPSLFARGRLQPVADYLGKTPSGMSFLNWDFNLASSSRYKEAFSDSAWAGVEVFQGLLEIHQPDLVVIDPLQSYNNLQESSNDQQRELIKRFKSIARNRNMAILLVDHDRKDTSGTGIDKLRGAANKGELCDTAIGLEPVEGSPDDLWFRFDKVRYINSAKPEPWRITRERDGDGKAVHWFCRLEEWQ